VSGAGVRRRHVVRGAVGALVVASVVGSAGRVPRRADADAPSFGTFALSASAAGVNVTEDRADAVAHPEGQGAIPWTTTSLSAGPVAYGLSTIAWPGALAGNAGKLSQVALPSAVGGVPIPDAVRQAILENSSAADYPIRAEAQNGSTPDASYGVPGTTLKSHADDANVTADAAVQGAAQSDTATYGNMTTHAASKLADTATSEATSLVQDVVLAGGAVKIGSVRSSAKAVTDGTTATAEGSTVVSELEIAGQKAYIDENGVHSGDKGQPVNAVSEQLLGAAMKGAGLDILLSAPRNEIDGASATFDAGSLLITWHPPSDQAPTFVWSLGGARVAVDAEPGFDLGLPGVGDVSADAGALGPADLGGGGPPSLGELGGALAPPAAPAAPGAGARRSTGAADGAAVGTATLAPISSVFDGNPASWVLGAFALAALLGWLGKRLAAQLVDAPAMSCPLDPGAHP
jgi:hypothetical protein